MQVGGCCLRHQIHMHFTSNTCALYTSNTYALRIKTYAQQHTLPTTGGDELLLESITAFADKASDSGIAPLVLDVDPRMCTCVYLCVPVCTCVYLCVPGNSEHGNAIHRGFCVYVYCVCFYCVACACCLCVWHLCVARCVMCTSLSA